MGLHALLMEIIAPKVLTQFICPPVYLINQTKMRAQHINSRLLWPNVIDNHMKLPLVQTLQGNAVQLFFFYEIHIL